MSASAVNALYDVFKDYHDETGDPRAGALVSLLYDVKAHNESKDKSKDGDK